jgi:putative transposase
VLIAKSRGPKLSVLSVLSLSPQQRITQYFKIQQRAFDQFDFVSVVCELRRLLRRPIIVVWDNLRAHKAAEKSVKLLEQRGLAFEPLPSYAPELNPVEAGWSHSKYGDLANFAPQDVAELEQAVIKSIRGQRENQDLLRSFFQAAKLKLDRPTKINTRPSRK